MKSIEANAISIKQYLSENGIQSSKDRGYYGIYHSPFREDHNASLKVDYNQNVWHDFGTGEGGGLIDLVMRMDHCSLHEAITTLERKYSRADVSTYQSANTPTSNFSFHRKNADSDLKSTKPSMTIMNVQPISNPALIEYLHERRISIDIARIHCSEVHYSVNDKPYYAIGFQNDKGGYELRSKYFKGCNSKDITSIKRNKDHCMLFEGFMDYLSFLTIKKLQNSPVDVIVLNSLANLQKVKNTLESYKSISAFLDNDLAGKRAVQELESIYKDVIDQSFLYSKHKDLNEYLCHKQQIQYQDLKKRSGLKP
ncbi:MAG: toprim domain-containing protein [Bacteroidota bacterium]|nr:toprim domain-containing protein [Bacteroidota bacterium]